AGLLRGGMRADGAASEEVDDLYVGVAFHSICVCIWAARLDLRIDLHGVDAEGSRDGDVAQQGWMVRIWPGVVDADSGEGAVGAPDLMADGQVTPHQVQIRRVGCLGVAGDVGG